MTRPVLLARISALHRQVLDSYYGQQKQRVERQYPLHRFVYRPLSMPFTTVLVAIGVTANQVTIFGFFLLMASLALMCAPGTLPALGIAGYCFGFMLDFVDGNIARFNRTASYFGKLFDSMVDTLSFLVFTAVAVYSINSGKNVLDWRVELGLGISTTFAALVRQNYIFRLVHLRREMGVIQGTLTAEQVSGNRSCLRLLVWLHENLAASVPVLLPIAAISDATSAFIVLFFFVHVIVGLTGVLVSLVKNKRELAKVQGLY
jgi:phosphatidylglycerophosphate synthase